MAAPTAPTSTTLVSEGLAKAGHSSPSAALTTRGNLWLEEIKNDIWNSEKKLKSLQTMSVSVLTKGKSRYSNPTDYASDLTLKLLDGTVTGTAQAGTSSSITLQSSDTSTEDGLIGKEIVITSGTGQGGIGQITAYNSSTKVATITPSLSTAPDSLSVYLIVGAEYPLSIDVVWRHDQKQFNPARLRPCSFYPLGDSDYGEFVLDCPPDKSYPVKMRYYANLLTLDLSSTLLSTLYQKWRNVWLSGIKWKALDNEDDTRSQSAEVEYRNELRKMIIEEMYGQNISNISAVLSE